MDNAEKVKICGRGRLEDFKIDYFKISRFLISRSLISDSDYWYSQQNLFGILHSFDGQFDFVSFLPFPSGKEFLSASSCLTAFVAKTRVPPFRVTAIKESEILKSDIRNLPSLPLPNGSD